MKMNIEIWRMVSESGWNEVGGWGTYKVLEAPNQVWV